MAEFNINRSIFVDIANGSTKAVQVGILQWINQKGRVKNAIAPDLLRMNTKIGQTAQSAMVSRYLATHKGLPSYRKGDRFAGGRLLRALKDESHVDASSTGLQFFNTNFMNRAAPQWYRLTFGAGKSKKVLAKSMSVRGKVIGADTKLSRYTERRAFSLPDIPGGNGMRWYVKSFGAGDMGAIHVSKRKGRSQIHGLSIQARGFVQAGVTVINEMYPVEATALIKKFMNSPSK